MSSYITEMISREQLTPLHLEPVVSLNSGAAEFSPKATLVSGSTGMAAGSKPPSQEPPFGSLDEAFEKMNEFCVKTTQYLKEQDDLLQEFSKETAWQRSTARIYDRGEQATFGLTKRASRKS